MRISSTMARTKAKEISLHDLIHHLGISAYIDPETGAMRSNAPKRGSHKVPYMIAQIVDKAYHDDPEHGARHALLKIGELIDSLTLAQGMLRDVTWGAESKTVDTNSLSVARMGCGGKGKPEKVIQHGKVRHYVGTGWVGETDATYEDYQRLPVARRAF